MSIGFDVGKVARDAEMEKEEKKKKQKSGKKESKKDGLSLRRNPEQILSRRLRPMQSDTLNSC